MEQSSKWKNARPVSAKWAVTCALLCAIVVSALWYSPLGRLVDTRVVDHFQFWVRDAVGKTPKIDARLKIYAFDDRTLSKTRSWVLSVAQWSQILETLAASEPLSIVIYQMFSMVPGTPEEIEEAVRRISTLSLKVVTGGFLTPPAAIIPYRDMLEPDRFLPPWIPANESSKDGENAGDFNLAPALPLADASAFNIYGPQKDLLPALKHIGHLMYDGSNSIKPFLKIDDRHLVSHASFLAGKPLKATAQSISIDNVIVPIRRNGTLPVNFVSASAFYSQGRVKTMHQLLDIAALGERSTKVMAGDVVLILPHMYTGHTDFAMTPYGQMPAGLVLASSINSVLTGQWVKSDSLGLVWIALLSLAGAFIALRSAGILVWVGGVLVCLLWALAGIGAFVYGNQLIDWFPAILSYSISSIAVFSKKSLSADRVTRLLKSSFEGVIPQDRMNEIISSYSTIDLKPRELTASVMFLDIVGFSKTTESLSSQMVFEDLREVHSRIGKIIHQYGGMIDRSLGDGVLVYFGVDLTDHERNMRVEEYAVRALQCAVEIQRQNQEICLRRSAENKSTYPLRIGINTAKAFFGDIGTSSRVDFTAIGVGVNFAKRLESACAPHGVCISQATYTFVGSQVEYGPAKFERMQIEIKHVAEPVTVFAYIG